MIIKADFVVNFRRPNKIIRMEGPALVACSIDRATGKNLGYWGGGVSEGAEKMVLNFLREPLSTKPSERADQILDKTDMLNEIIKGDIEFTHVELEKEVRPVLNEFIAVPELESLAKDAIAKLFPAVAAPAPAPVAPAPIVPPVVATPIAAPSGADPVAPAPSPRPTVMPFAAVTPPAAIAPHSFAELVREDSPIPLEAILRARYDGLVSDPDIKKSAGDIKREIGNAVLKRVLVLRNLSLGDILESVENADDAIAGGAIKVIKDLKFQLKDLDTFMIGGKSIREAVEDRKIRSADPVFHLVIEDMIEAYSTPPTPLSEGVKKEASRIVKAAQDAAADLPDTSGSKTVVFKLTPDRLEELFKAGEEGLVEMMVPLTQLAEELRAKLSEAISNRDRLLAENATQVTNNRVVFEKLEEISQRAAALETSFTKANEALVAQKHLLETTIKAHGEQTDRLNRDHDTEIAGLQSELATSHARIQELEGDISALRALTPRRPTLTGLAPLEPVVPAIDPAKEQELRELRTQLAAETVRAEDLKQQLDAAIAAQAKLQDEFDGYKFRSSRHAADLGESIRKLEVQIDPRANSQLDEALKEIERLKAENTVLIADLAAARVVAPVTLTEMADKVTQLEAEYTAIVTGLKALEREETLIELGLGYQKGRLTDLEEEIKEEKAPLAKAGREVVSEYRQKLTNPKGRIVKLEQMLFNQIAMLNSLPDANERIRIGTEAEATRLDLTKEIEHQRRSYRERLDKIKADIRRTESDERAENLQRLKLNIADVSANLAEVEQNIQARRRESIELVTKASRAFKETTAASSMVQGLFVELMRRLGQLAKKSA